MNHTSLITWHLSARLGLQTNAQRRRVWWAVRRYGAEQIWHLADHAINQGLASGVPAAILFFDAMAKYSSVRRCGFV